MQATKQTRFILFGIYHDQSQRTNEIAEFTGLRKGLNLPVIPAVEGKSALG